MQRIQKKIILEKLVGMLANEQITRTTLKRTAGYPQADVLDAIDYGAEKGVLEILASGYVEVIREGYAVQEVDYYDCVKGMLQKHYEDRLTSEGRFLVAKTARKDTKVAGRWTRPDFTVVANRKFPYIREAEFDIITFEVKRPADCEALAVFEALAHNSAATRSYVFFPITEEELDRNQQAERIREECVRHGIGLFVVKDSYKLGEACLLLESQRRPLNPEKCSQFLQNVLEQKELGTITTWP